MISKSDIIEIGKFRKTHALKGELNASLDVDADFVNDGNPLIVEMEGIPVPFYVESIRPKGSETFLVKLNGVDSGDEASAFVNKEIYALRSDLGKYYDADPEELIAEDDLIGSRIVDSVLGEIGVLKDIDTSTQNTLLVAENPGGKEFFIPYVDEFINDHDPETKIIHVSLPEGLLDIN